jgi:uncharacterized membrane protein
VNSSEKPALTLELRLANLLSFGTLLAASLLAAGLMLSVLTRYTLARDFLLLLGIGLLIALPVVRILVTGLVLLYRRELVYAAIAGLVLLIVTASLLYIGGKSPRECNRPPLRECPAATSCKSPMTGTVVGQRPAPWIDTCWVNLSVATLYGCGASMSFPRRSLRRNSRCRKRR